MTKEVWDMIWFWKRLWHDIFGHDDEPYEAATTNESGRNGLVICLGCNTLIAVWLRGQRQAVGRGAVLT